MSESDSKEYGGRSFSRLPTAKPGAIFKPPAGAHVDPPARASTKDYKRWSYSPLENSGAVADSSKNDLKEAAGAVIATPALESKTP